jgi:predicted nucleic acid-binding protein
VRLYLDTSVILRFVLNQPPLLSGFGRWKVAYTSEIMGVEARRTLDRLRLGGQLTDEDISLAYQALTEIEDTLSIVAVNRGVLYRAGLSFPTVVKTLDAIHLATALLLRETPGEPLPPLTVATHDRQFGIAATALGFLVVGLG